VLLLHAAAGLRCADRQERTGGGWVKGDPTEGALVVAAAKAGLHKPELDQRFPRVDEIPFTSETKRMTTLHEPRHGRPTPRARRR
jgi:P-type Ca2+ transporter type 2C